MLSNVELGQWWDDLNEDDRSKFSDVFDQDWFEQQGADTQAAYAHLASSLYSFLGETSTDAHDDDFYVGFAPVMLRASFHSSGTYDVPSGTGGSNGGTIFHDAELADDGNGCIAKATEQLQALFKGHNVPLADAAVIAGAIALDVMHVSVCVDCIVKCHHLFHLVSQLMNDCILLHSSLAWISFALKGDV